MRMKLIAALAVLAMLAIWGAQLADAITPQQRRIVTGSKGFSGGSPPVDPSCSNSLDFTAACNSQYLGAI